MTAYSDPNSDIDAGSLKLVAAGSLYLQLLACADHAYSGLRYTRYGGGRCAGIPHCCVNLTSAPV
jgi:hypothetical protein